MAWGTTEEVCMEALQANLESAIEEALRNHRYLPQPNGVVMATLDHVMNS